MYTVVQPTAHPPTHTNTHTHNPLWSELSKEMSLSQFVRMSAPLSPAPAVSILQVEKVVSSEFFVASLKLFDM